MAVLVKAIVIANLGGNTVYSSQADKTVFFYEIQKTEVTAYGKRSLQNLSDGRGNAEILV